MSCHCHLTPILEYIDKRMPISMTNRNGTKYYLHYDQVGSLRIVSDTNHNIIKEIVYDTYGNILSDSNETFIMPFGFAGGLYDSDTKLTRFGYRDYDAYTGKWTAKDPIEFSGGDSNLYGYVLGNPINLIDIDGLKGGKIRIIPRYNPPSYYPEYNTPSWTSFDEWWNGPHWWETDSCESDDEESCEIERERAGMICLEHYGDPDWFSVTGKYYSLEHCKMGLVSQRCGGNKVD